MAGRDASGPQANEPLSVQDALIGKPVNVEWLGRSWHFMFGEDARLALNIPWRIKGDFLVAPGGGIQVGDTVREANSLVSERLVTGCRFDAETGDVSISFDELKLEAFNTASALTNGDPWRLTFSREEQPFVATWNPFGGVHIEPLSDARHSGRARRKYCAFISYSHSDLVFARRLHSWLESFTVGRGGTRPLKAIFRDEGEITAGSLTAAIMTALEESDTLIVICSDAASSSEWVAQEIEHFRRVRPDGACLAIFSPGSHHGTLLPPSLRPTETEEPYIPSPADDGDLLAFLRLTAGLLSLPLDEVQRYYAEQRDTQRKRYQEIVDGWGEFTRDQRGWYERTMGKVLVDYACQYGVSEYQFGEMFTDGVGVVEEVARALSGNSRETSGNFWPVNIQNHRLRNAKSPPVDRQELDAAVIRYLGLPIRQEEFDRLLVEVLVCTTLFGLRDFMERPHEAWGLASSERKAYERALKSPWLGTIRDYCLPFLYFAAVVGGVELLAATGWIGDAARDIMRYVVAVIVIGYGLLAIIAVPGVIAKNRLVRKTMDRSMIAIEKVIHVLRGGAVSVVEIRKVVSQAEASEVTWPSSLAALLDDIGSRRVALWAPAR